MSRNLATAIGFIAILLWSTLALLTAISGNIPPFQLTAMSFAIAALIGMISWIARPVKLSALRQPWRVWVVGIGGLFGYHFFYFTALQRAPLVEASLIAYLWPLLIVLFSAFLPGEKLRAHHVLGALMGFGGAVLIVTKGSGLRIDMGFVAGYAAALLCALIWSGYSIVSRVFADVPSDVVTGFCLATAALSLLCHLALERTVWPSSWGQGMAVLGLGLGPVGLAFFVWDYGVKRGNIQLLGASSYAAPLLSTLILIAFGYGEPDWTIAIACLAITGGAMIAALDLFCKKDLFGKKE